MSNSPLIACARCAVSKARCDKKVPCSQCVARNYVCQPRCTSRRPRPSRKPAERSQGLTASAEVMNIDSDRIANMEQFSSFALPNSDDLFGLPSTASPHGALDVTEYADLVTFSFPGMSRSGDTADTSMAETLFSTMPWFSAPDSQSEILGARVPPQEAGNTEAHKKQQSMSCEPSQLPTPISLTAQLNQEPQATPIDFQDGSTQYQYPGDVQTTGNGASDDVIGDMVDLLTQPGEWRGLPDSCASATQVISHDARDRIVAAVQLLLHRAMQTRYSLLSSSQGLFGQIVVLPPSHVLVHFIELYAARVESTQPYLGLAGSPKVSIKAILEVDMTDVGILLVILLITQGAMLTDHRESLILADGLTEVCRVALNDVLESRSIAQPMVGGSALQVLTLCAWSGKQSFASFAMSKRGQYLSILKETGLLQPEPTPQNSTSNGMDLWGRWKEREQRNRHSYAWVYVDLETSLLHDLPPVLSINDLHVSLPQDIDLWHAQSYGAWLEHYGASGARLDEETQSLCSLFRSFLQGRLGSRKNLSFHHLRLLLHPLQAMVLEQQQFLRIFGTDEPSNKYRVLSKIKVLGRLQEIQDLLQQLTTLLSQASHSDIKQDKNGSSHSAESVSMIMLHLVSLNVFTSTPEIERCAKEKPPVSDSERTEMWRWARYPEGENYILFHSGQIFRLIANLHIDARPPWWSVAVYRASMACWSLRSPVKTSIPSQLPVISIDSLLPHEEDRFLNSHGATAVVRLRGGKQLAILQGNNSLYYCIDALERYPSRLVRVILEKVRFFSERWDISSQPK